MVIDNDDVAFRHAPAHLCNEAAAKLLAIGPGAAVNAGVQLGPQLAIFWQRSQLCPVASLSRFFPLRNLLIVIYFFQTAQYGLIPEIIEFLPAQIIVPALHVADAQLAQMLLQERDVLEKELLLQGLGSSRNNY